MDFVKECPLRTAARFFQGAEPRVGRHCPTNEGATCRGLLFILRIQSAAYASDFLIEKEAEKTGIRKTGINVRCFDVGELFQNSAFPGILRFS
jgi:hypothetical protein